MASLLFMILVVEHLILRWRKVFSGRVSVLAHGGIAMCGGREFDLVVFDNVVKPWLCSHFDLPEEFAVSEQFKSLRRMAIWATERAKIELSQKDHAAISLPETELGVKDLSGEEIYLDITLNRGLFDELISSKIEEFVEAARDTIEKAGLTPHDVERIVFIGGPTHYKPLRDKAASELGIAPSADVNPMTAVAEGAAFSLSRSTGRQRVEVARVREAGSLHKDVCSCLSLTSPEHLTERLRLLPSLAGPRPLVQSFRLTVSTQDGRQVVCR